MYRPQQAHLFYLQWRAQKAKSRIAPSTRRLIEHFLRQDWNPERISIWLYNETHPCISYEWIYQYVLADKQAGGTLYRHLRYKKQRKKRYGVYSRRGQIPDQVSIVQCLAVVDGRTLFGDWELDTVIGKNHRQALVTLVERKSRLTLIAKVMRKTAENFSATIIQLLKPLAPWEHSLTADSGRAFAQHLDIAKQLNARDYFAHPFTSWESGLNENTNGLIRQCFPKEHDFTTITEKQIEKVMNKLNNRPRKCLGFKHPIRYFSGLNQTLH